MEKAVTRRKWTTGLIIAGAAALVITFWSLIMSMLSLLAVAGVLALLSLPLCKVLEKRLPGGAAAAIALLTLLGAEPKLAFEDDVLEMYRNRLAEFKKSGTEFIGH